SLRLISGTSTAAAIGAPWRPGNRKPSERLHAEVGGGRPSRSRSQACWAAGESSKTGSGIDKDAPATGHTAPAGVAPPMIPPAAGVALCRAVIRSRRSGTQCPTVTVEPQEHAVPDNP